MHASLPEEQPLLVYQLELSIYKYPLVLTNFQQGGSTKIEQKKKFEDTQGHWSKNHSRKFLINCVKNLIKIISSKAFIVL